MEQRSDPHEPDQAALDALIALHGRQRFEELLTQGGKLAERFPQSARLQNILGGANAALLRHDAALAHYRRAVELNPKLAVVHHDVARLLNAMGRTGEAIVGYRRAIEIDPGFARAHFGLANLLKSMGHLEEARRSYEQLIAIAPDHAGALNNLGNLLRDVDRLPEAIDSFERALRSRPDFADAHFNLGLTMAKLERIGDAAACFARAVAIDPDHFRAQIALGKSLLEQGDRPGMIAAYREAERIMPDNDAVRADRIHQQAHICDWDAIAADAADLPQLGLRGRPVNSYAMLVMDDAPDRQRARAENFARIRFPQPRRAAIARPEAAPARLRVGYFSADFHDHAVMRVLARTFELHDRERFEVHAFSYGRDSDGAMRGRLRAAFDSFHDVRTMSDAEVAELARERRIDIAVDLMGYTSGARLEIFALGAAPVQISYLGYPGTLGTRFIDYLIADRTVIPDAERRHYAEKLIQLPDSYQPNDDRRAIADPPAGRSALGLPEQGFVFCCFNNSFKIGPAEFDIWMRLLQRVEGSVLWLLEANRWAADNLRRQAARRGVDPTRLVFAPARANDVHLARLAFADLFLDCFACNAHATASDALWAGVPVLSLPGHSFVARVGASLLHAIGLPELIAGSREDYERIALELATDGEKLAAIRRRLAENRTSMPLFASERFTRHLEDGYERAWRRWFDGLEPATIEVQRHDG